MGRKKTTNETQLFDETINEVNHMKQLTPKMIRNAFGWLTELHLTTSGWFVKPKLSYGKDGGANALCLEWVGDELDEHFGYERAWEVKISENGLPMAHFTWKTSVDNKQRAQTFPLVDRWASFSAYMRQFSPVRLSNHKYPCVCCGYMSFTESIGSYSICQICGWEDDYVQIREDWWDNGGANASLRSCQQNFMHPEHAWYRHNMSRRPILAGDVKDPMWYPLPAQHELVEAASGAEYFQAVCESETVQKNSPYYWLWDDGSAPPKSLCGGAPDANS
jgi:hypothetical protein